ncbi:formylglycine-generating enzyme family protein [Roseivirga seohaensis]|uniref:formylglycine-generating enzyme family protein n=1 Tax=Roseivirga seohaensis TaxID=1914963 RepID=UPI003BA9E894
MNSFYGKIVTTWLCLVIPLTTLAQQKNMVLVKGGEFIPLYGVDSATVKVNSFFMDVYPVTNAEYQQFVIDHPKWRKSKVLKLYADASYLANWENDTTFSKDFLPNAPITSVSWFAAKSYCEYQGKRLPTVDEWEYAAMADAVSPDARKKEDYNKYILSWYETSNTIKNPIGSTFKNYWGIYDLHGAAWEWTLDFNSVLISGESRKDVDKDSDLFCGSAAVGASDLMNYAAFMRYAFRGSIKARYSIKNLGFRCIQDVNTNQ